MSAEAAEIPGQVSIAPTSSSDAVAEPPRQPAEQPPPRPADDRKKHWRRRAVCRTCCWLLFPFAFLAVYVFVVEIYLRCHSFLGCENEWALELTVPLDLDVSGCDVNLRPAAAGEPASIAGKMLRGVKVSEPTRDSKIVGPDGRGALQYLQIANENCDDHAGGLVRCGGACELTISTTTNTAGQGLDLLKLQMGGGGKLSVASGTVVEELRVSGSVRSMIVNGAIFNSKLKVSITEGTITVADTDAPSFSLRTKSGSVAFYDHTLPDRSYTLDYRSNQEQICVRALDVESFADTIEPPWSSCDISQSKWRKKLQKQYDGDWNTKVTVDEFKEGLEELPICLGGKCPLKTSTAGLQSLLFDADDGSRRSYCKFSDFADRIYEQNLTALVSGCTRRVSVIPNAGSTSSHSLSMTADTGSVLVEVGDERRVLNWPNTSHPRLDSLSSGQPGLRLLQASATTLLSIRDEFGGLDKTEELYLSMEVVTQKHGSSRWVFTTNPVYVDLEPARLLMISGGALSPAIRQERIETYDGDCVGGSRSDWADFSITPDNSRLSDEELIEIFALLSKALTPNKQLVMRGILIHYEPGSTAWAPRVATFSPVPGGDDDSIRVQRCFEHFHPDNSSDLGCPSWFSRSSGFLRRAWVISIIIAVIWTIAISWTALKYTRTLLQHLRKRRQIQDMLANLAVDVASHNKALKSSTKKARRDKVLRQHIDALTGGGKKWAETLLYKVLSTDDTVTELMHFCIEIPIKRMLGNSVKSFVSQQCATEQELDQLKARKLSGQSGGLVSRLSLRSTRKGSVKPSDTDEPEALEWKRFFKEYQNFCFRQDYTIVDDFHQIRQHLHEECPDVTIRNPTAPETILTGIRWLDTDESPDPDSKHAKLQLQKDSSNADILQVFFARHCEVTHDDDQIVWRSDDQNRDGLKLLTTWLAEDSQTAIIGSCDSVSIAGHYTTVEGVLRPPAALSNVAARMGVQVKREQIRTLHGLYLLSDLRAQGFEAVSSEMDVRWVWWVIQAALVSAQGVIVFGILFLLFEIGTSLQAVYMSSTWAFDAHFSPLTRLDWLSWTPIGAVIEEQSAWVDDVRGSSEDAVPEVSLLLGIGVAFFTAAWLRMCCTSLDSDRTLPAFDEDQKEGRPEDTAEAAVQFANAKLLLVMKFVQLLVQFFFFGALAAIVVVGLFFFILSCEWLIVASVIKPAAVMPYGAGLVTTWASARAVARGIQEKATKLKQKLRDTTEKQMKRQFLLFDRREKLEKERWQSGDEGGHSSFLHGKDGGEQFTITDAEVSEVEPSDIFARFAAERVEDPSQPTLSRPEFNRIFNSLGWAATTLERDQMFAHCDVHPNDKLLTESEWVDGWDALLTFQVEKTAERLGLTDKNVIRAVVVVVVNIVALVVFLVFAASAFTESSNFIATVQSVFIGGQGGMLVIFRGKSKGEDDEEAAKEVAKAGGE